MSDPIKDVFLFGKAFTEVMSEKVEDKLTNLLSDIGKFDAETRQSLQEFAEEVKLRAEREKNQRVNTNTTITVSADDSVDLQELLDELRAEIAHLKSELNNYRQKL
jgi:Sec-independent protein translocase protein TatA